MASLQDAALQAAVRSSQPRSSAASAAGAVATTCASAGRQRPDTSHPASSAARQAFASAVDTGRANASAIVAFVASRSARSAQRGLADPGTAGGADSVLT
jgi:hypothetical protein